MNQVVPARSKFVLLLVVSVFVVVGSVLFILLHHEDGDDRVTFTLQDTKGNSVTEDKLKGQWSILVFGFTHCPDICPSQAFTIAQSLKIIDKTAPATDVQAVFISVDYRRDNAERLDNYLAYFHPRFVGFLGSKLQLDLVTDAFNASYSVTEQSQSGKNVQVTHSSSIYLIDPNGHIAKQLSFETSAELLADTLSTLI